MDTFLIELFIIKKNITQTLTSPKHCRAAFFECAAILSETKIQKITIIFQTHSMNLLAIISTTPGLEKFHQLSERLTSLGMMGHGGPN